MAKTTTAADLLFSLKDEGEEKVVDCTISFYGPHTIVLALVISYNVIEARLFCNNSSFAVDLPKSQGSRPLGASFLTLEPLVVAFLFETGEISTLDLSPYFHGDGGTFHDKEEISQKITERKGYKNFLKRIKKSDDVLTRKCVAIKMKSEMFRVHSSCLVQADEWDSSAGAMPHRMNLVHAPDHGISMLAVSLLNGTIAHIDSSLGMRVTHPQLFTKVWANRAAAGAEIVHCNLFPIAHSSMLAMSSSSLAKCEICLLRYEAIVGSLEDNDWSPRQVEGTGGSDSEEEEDTWMDSHKHKALERRICVVRTPLDSIMSESWHTSIDREVWLRSLRHVPLTSVACDKLLSVQRTSVAANVWEACCRRPLEYDQGPWIALLASEMWKLYVFRASKGNSEDAPVPCLHIDLQPVLPPTFQGEIRHASLSDDRLYFVTAGPEGDLVTVCSLTLQVLHVLDIGASILFCHSPYTPDAPWVWALAHAHGLVLLSSTLLGPLTTIDEELDVAESSIDLTESLSLLQEAGKCEHEKIVGMSKNALMSLFVCSWRTRDKHLKGAEIASLLDLCKEECKRNSSMFDTYCDAINDDYIPGEFHLKLALICARDSSYAPLLPCLCEMSRAAGDVRCTFTLLYVCYVSLLTPTEQWDAHVMLRRALNAMCDSLDALLAMINAAAVIDLDKIGQSDLEDCLVKGFEMHIELFLNARLKEAADPSFFLPYLTRCFTNLLMQWPHGPELGQGRYESSVLEIYLRSCMTRRFIARKALLESLQAIQSHEHVPLTGKFLFDLTT